MYDLNGPVDSGEDFKKCSGELKKLLVAIDRDLMNIFSLIF
jgi:hypothetical protein